MEKKPEKKERIKNSFLVMQDVNYQLFLDSILEEVKMGAAHPRRAEEVLKVGLLAYAAGWRTTSMAEGTKSGCAGDYT